jgi:S-adenosylmethionine hydrolase
VLRIDRFGNLVTNIDRRAFDRMIAAGRIQITIGDHPIDRVVGTYAEVPAGEMGALFGSTDHLEVAVNGGSAAQRLGLSRGASVRIVTVC